MKRFDQMFRLAFGLLACASFARAENFELKDHMEEFEVWYGVVPDGFVKVQCDATLYGKSCLAWERREAGVRALLKVHYSDSNNERKDWRTCYDIESLVGAPVESTQFGNHTFRLGCKEESKNAIRFKYNVVLPTHSSDVRYIATELNFEDSKGGYETFKLVPAGLRKIAGAGFEQIQNTLRPASAKDAVDAAKPAAAKVSGTSEEAPPPPVKARKKGRSADTAPDGEPKPAPLPD